MNMKILGIALLFALLCVVAAAQDEAPVSDEMLKKYDKDGDGKLTRFVVLPTCPDAHEEISKKVDGKEPADAV